MFLNKPVLIRLGFIRSKMMNFTESSLPAPLNSLPSLCQLQEVSQPTCFDPLLGLYKIENDEFHRIISTRTLKFAFKLESLPTWFETCGIYKIDHDEIHKILSTYKLKFSFKLESTSNPTALCRS